MTRKLRAHSLILVAISLPLSGCLVSFEDYPLASSGAGGVIGVGATTTAGDANSGGTSAGGSAAGDIAVGGSDAGDTSVAGSSSGGSDQAGSSGDGQGGVGGAVLPPPALIDDFEDGDAQVVLAGGRDGSWFILNDGSGQQTPAAAGPTLPSALVPLRGTSTRAMHTTGSGFSVWGAMLGVNFLSSMPPLPYDISMYQGLTFVAKLGRPGVTKQMRVSVSDFDTSYGCRTCGDHFGTSVTLTDVFTPVQVSFSALREAGWGVPQARAFDPKRTYSVVFSWIQNQSFDVWIDDLSFY